jgi:hypothetical protein
MCFYQWKKINIRIIESVSENEFTRLVLYKLWLEIIVVASNSKASQDFNFHI